MLKRLFILLLILSAAPAAAGEKPAQLLGAYDFAGGGYSLLGTIWGRERHEIQRKLGNFYVEDIALLQEMKKVWVTHGPAPFQGCGYHYTVYLLREQRVAGRFSINLEVGCGSVVTDKGAFFYQPSLLTGFAKRYRKPVIERKQFDSLAKGRRALARLAGNRRLLLQPTPAWRDYDGAFRFMAPCPGHGHDDTKVQACLEQVRAEIAATYPGEPFALEETGGDSEHIMVEMKGSKSLHDRFDLYEDYWDWRDFEPRLTLYWKEPR